MLPFNFHDHVKAGFLLAFMLFLCYNNARVNFVESPETLDIKGFLKIFGFYLTQADDLGRFVTRDLCAHSHPRGGIDPIISS